MSDYFKQKSIWLWQNAEKILIITFLATFTLNVRKVFLTPYSYLNGEFNEYTTSSFSWADLLMILIILIYTIKWLLRQGETLGTGEVQDDNGSVKQYNNNSDKSSTPRFPQNVSHFLCSINNYLCQVFKGETILLLLFLIWTMLSVSWSVYKPIAIYRTANLLVIIAFISILAANLRDKKRLKIAFFALLLNGVFQSALGIAQFLNNGSVGLHFLGESIVSQNLPGVAKIVIAGEKHIRAYGTFPHPNVMAGFLLIPVFLLVSSLLFRTRQAQGVSEKVSHETFFSGIPRKGAIVSLAVVSLGFFLTFSRSAFLGLFFGLLALFLVNFKSKFACFKPLQRRVFYIKVFLLLLLIICVSFVLLRNTSLFSRQSLAERNFYGNVSRATISEHPIFGIGIGQSVFSEFKNYPDLEGWQYQPVHNVYLLIFSELGAIGLILFLLFLFNIVRHCVWRERDTKLSLTHLAFYFIIISFLFLALFDHFFWDIKIGMITFALAIIFPRIVADNHKLQNNTKK